MKNLAATSVVALALTLSANSVRAADYDARIQQLVVSGVVESWIGGSFLSNIENGDEDNLQPDHDSYFTSGQAGRLSLPLGDMMSLQMDANNEITSNAFGDFDDDFAYAFDFGVHLSARDPSRGLFGVFGAFGGATGDQSDDGATDRQNFWAVGGEAQYYADNTTFYVQGGYLDSEPDDSDADQDGLHDAFFVRGVARWFMTPDSRLQGEVAYADGSQDGPANDVKDMEVIQWGVRYDTVISGLPLIGDSAVFVGYRGIHFDNGCCGEDDASRFTEHTIMAGFSHHFGGQTLLEFDRVGATLDMPNFGRWVAAGDQID